MTKIAIYLFAAFISICFSYNTAQAQQKPNVIFILADDLGYGDLSCYGNPSIHTPNLDKMARNGFKAGTFYTPSPSCTPTRASLMTGKYANRLGLPSPIGPGTKRGLDTAEFTLADLFNSQGYSTALVGKWHLGDQAGTLPWEHGFDYFYGLLYSHDYRYPFVNTDTVLAIFENNKKIIQQPDYTMLTQWEGNEALKFVDKSAANSQPFFLYLAFSMPHLPLGVSEPWKNSGQGGKYGDVIREIDHTIGRLMQKLKERKLLDNTLIIFSSDNGPWSNMPDRMLKSDMVKPWDAGSTGPFRGAKGTTYEGGHRVPFIAYWPGKIPKARFSAEPISMIDMLPTLAAAIDYAGAVPTDIDGTNVWDLMSGKTDSLPKRALYYVNAKGIEALRFGDWKLRIIASDKKKQIELFNLNNDFGEHFNLAQKYPEKVKEMMGYWEKGPE